MSSSDHASVNFNTLLASVALTLCVGGSAYWNYRQEHGKTLDLARQQAFDHINKDLSFRRWATSHTAASMFRSTRRRRPISI